MLVCAAAGFAATGMSLFITFTDNTKVEFALAEQPTVTIADDVLTVTTSSTTATYTLQKVNTFTYGSSTAIRTVSNDGVIIGSDQIIVTGTNPRLRIFALNGTAVKVEPKVVGDRTIVSLNNLSKGVYIISINGKSLKIARK